eukprot:SAG31_NODE_2380_length_5833_cov_1.859435_4_plen_98_part_00
MQTMQTLNNLPSQVRNFEILEHVDPAERKGAQQMARPVSASQHLQFLLVDAAVNCRLSHKQDGANRHKDCWTKLFAQPEAPDQHKSQHRHRAWKECN